MIGTKINKSDYMSGHAFIASIIDERAEQQ